MEVVGRTYGPGRDLYALAGPADPTFDELSERMQMAYQAAARFLAYQQALDSLPSVQQPPRPRGVDEWRCQVSAVESVLKRSEMVTWEGGVQPTDIELQELAEECVAAADTGI